MLPGETLATGCPVLCPDCRVEVLPLRVLHSSAGYYIGTCCACGPAYTRESGYYATGALAEAALADRSLGRGGILASAVAVYWTDRVDPRTFHIAILHTSEPSRLHGFMAAGTLARVFEFPVRARTPEAACKVTFAVANSEPDSLFCDARYADQVAAYRAAGLRSLAIGDVLLVGDDTGGETAWVCGPRSFRLLSVTPTYRTSP